MSPLLSLQPCSPFIKQLIGVRTEDASCRQQPTEIVCYTLLRNIKSITNTKKLAEFPFKTGDLGLLLENWEIG